MPLPCVVHRVRPSALAVPLVPQNSGNTFCETDGITNIVSEFEPIPQSCDLVLFLKITYPTQDLFDFGSLFRFGETSAASFHHAVSAALLTVISRSHRKLARRRLTRERRQAASSLLLLRPRL